VPHLNPRKLTFRGRTQTIGQWARELGIPENTIRSRLDRLGQSVEEALGTPPRAKFRPGKAGRAKPPRPAPKLAEDSQGRAVAVWVDGGVRHKRVFGAWGDPAATTAYSRWAAEWHVRQADPTPPGSPGDVLVADLVVACLDWAEATYRKGGRETSEVAAFRAALRPLAELYGDTPAAAFGPVQLLAIQAGWVAGGLAIGTVNNYQNKVCRAFSHGVSRGVVAAAVADALAHVPQLVPGRTAAAPRKVVTSAPDADLAAAIPHLHHLPDRQRILEGIVRLQLATGMRPGEVLELRPEDLDRSREPWLYRPPSGGKTYHLEKARKVWIGPAGRALLLPFLADAEPGEPVFRVRAIRGRKPWGLIPISAQFYRDCLARACEVADVPVITPHRLRHSKATAVQRAYEDDEAVAAALGNSKETARQVYVDSPADAVARRIAEELG